MDGIETKSIEELENEDLQLFNDFFYAMLNGNERRARVILAQLNEPKKPKPIRKDPRESGKKYLQSKDLQEGEVKSI